MRPLASLLLTLILTSSAGAQDADVPFGGQFEDQCKGNWTFVPSAQEAQFIAKFMGDRSHRMWHAYWHALRTDWALLTDEQQQLMKTAAKIAYGIDPASGRNPPEGHDWQPSGPKNGIDFFYMHHAMLTALFTELARNGMPCVRPWGTRLSKGDFETEDFGQPGKPAPAAAMQRLQVLASQFLADKTSPQRDYLLSTAKLGTVGDEIEGELHGGMHNSYGMPPDHRFDDCDVDTALIARSPEDLQEALRKSDPPRQYPTELNDAEKEQLQAWQKWNGNSCEDPSNNSLLNTETAHVNWIFYKLHGLVEASMLSWAVVHGYSGVENPDGKCPSNLPGCFHFRDELGRAPWVGGEPMHHGDHAKMKKKNYALEAADRLVSKKMAAPDGALDRAAKQEAYRIQQNAPSKYLQSGGPKGAAPVSSDLTMKQLKANPQFRKDVQAQVALQLNKSVKDMAKRWTSRLGDGKHMREDKVSGCTSAVVGCGR